MAEELTVVQIVSVSILPIVFAITLHEVAHGCAARALGDDTAARLGRLTVNPISHIDPIGTLLVPGIILASQALLNTSGMLIGWAKPVPVDFRKLKHPLRDMAFVAIAGPAANLLMAVFWAIMIRTSIVLEDDFASEPLHLMGQIGIDVNLMLFLLNLLPIPPLDGGRVLTGMLPLPLATRFNRIEAYGLPILLLLMATGLLAEILQWPLVHLENLFARFALWGLG